jgi:hypothetical protein
MPFHPTCFDIYARLSRLHFDHVDINGLMEWYRIDGSYNVVHNFPRNEDVRTGNAGGDEGWNHAPNGEYLAANPLFVPGLAEILQSTIHMEASFSSRAGAFALATDQEPKAQDRFTPLPEEIRLEILSFLASSDITNLRLASRAYRQLPIFLWRKLLQKEMPWLWEVWDTEEPHPWALVGTVARYKKKQKEIENREEELKTLQFSREILKEEMPEALESEAWIAAEERLVSKPKLPDPLLAIRAEALESLAWTLPAENTNWFEVYTLVTRHWKYLKGLQNRRRIWTDIGRITSKIRKYRLKGKIKDGRRLGEI